MNPTLHGRFESAARAHPDRPALFADGRIVTYADLEERVRALERTLERGGIGRGDRVGIHARKSAGSVAALLAVVKRGAAYVPVDTTAPISRAVEILVDCGVKAVFTDVGSEPELEQALHLVSAVGSATFPDRFGDGGKGDLSVLPCAGGQPSAVDGLAYVLYTSGSTGKPKGVMHTHATALAFVDWCVRTFEPVPDDRFSSHAPFHFDLSILDVYVPLTTGSGLVLIDETDGKNPHRLAPLISESGITVWYSTPSVLRLLLEHGRLGEHDFDRLRLVLFAGEVFAPRDLSRLQEAWPRPGYFNLYGPTETNVCTYHEVERPVSPTRVEPFPIGKPIDGDQVRVANEDGRQVPPGTEGELQVRGATVMAGYWDRPELNASAFVTDEGGRRWYRTGDVVLEDDVGDHVFIGRRDRMIKRHGYRVELGEIEAALYRHPDVREVAVVSTSDAAAGTRIRAFLNWGGRERPTTIELKRFCADNLPLYMVPDDFTVLERLPKTSTDKINYVEIRSIR